MKRLTSQLWLTGIFLLGLILAEAAVVIAYVRGSIADADIERLSTTLLKTYAVPLAVAIAAIFADGPRQSAERAIGQAALRKMRLAAVLAALWNLLLLWRTGVFLMRALDPASENPNEVAQLEHYIERVAELSSFLIAAALVWLFGERDKER
ncbi:MAG: hypothetical protein WDO68_31035 [Gammaproteobacteria bacterium]